MSKFELRLWAGDFVISGIGWFFGGPYAAGICFVIGGLLIFLSLRKTEHAEGNNGILIDEHTPYVRERIKSWHKVGLGVFALCAVALLVYGLFHYIGKGKRAAAPYPPTVADISPRLYVNPAKLVFRGQRIGTTSEPQNIIVTNHGSGIGRRMMSPLKITGDFSQSNDCGPELEVGDSCTIEVTFSPTESGLAYGDIEVPSTDPLFPNLYTNPARVTFSGSGVEGKATSAQKHNPPATSPTSVQNTPGGAEPKQCNVVLASYDWQQANPGKPLDPVYKLIGGLMETYADEHNGDCPKNDWLNGQLKKLGYWQLFANINCESSSTGVSVRMGTGSETNFNDNLSVERGPCDVGIDVQGQGTKVTFNGKVNVTVVSGGDMWVKIH